MHDPHGELVAPHGEPAIVAQRRALGQRQRQRLPAVAAQRARAAALVAQPRRASAARGGLRCAHVEECRCNKDTLLMDCCCWVLKLMCVDQVKSH